MLGNPSKKTIVLAPMTLGKKIRTKFRRPIAIQEQVRSLGRYHNLSKRGSAEPIVEKAKTSCFHVQKDYHAAYSQT